MAEKKKTPSQTTFVAKKVPSKNKTKSKPVKNKVSPKAAKAKLIVEVLPQTGRVPLKKKTPLEVSARKKKSVTLKSQITKPDHAKSKTTHQGRPRPRRVSSSQLAAQPDDLEIVTAPPARGGELVVVGIGASAGGLEALQVLIPTLPHTNQITYVLAQHLDPKHPSMLVTLLSRHSEMPILELRDGTTPRPGTIYITPPDRNVVFEKGKLMLAQPRAGSVGPKPSIDIFFSSLGEELAERAVGIILSGTGSDGAHGVKAIKAAGGFIIVQDPLTAKYDGMPRTSIDTGCVDLILPSPEIGRELPGILVYPTRLPLLIKEEASVRALQTLYARLHQSTGCDFSEYKQNTIHRRIGRRMAVHKIHDVTEYLELAETSPGELDALYKDIIISVTSLFRDAQAYGVLKDVIDQIVDSKSEGDNLRMWVAGCASGEEAYSIAMLVADSLTRKNRTLKVNIFATDIDTDALARARKGLYPEASIVDVPKTIVAKYFTRTENQYRVLKSIREMVVFSRQDLVKDPPFSRLDLVSCRNVLIYFSPHLQQRLLPIFHYILNPNGFMFLGKSESTGQFLDLFSPVEKKSKIFRRRGGGRTRRVQVGPLALQHFKPLSSGKARAVKEPSLGDVVNKITVEAYGHPGVVVDDHMNVILVRGEVGSYLTLAQGEAGLNVLAMIRPDLRAELRSILIKCTREQIPLSTKNLILDMKGKAETIQLHLRPIKSESRQAGAIVIFFESIPTVKPVKLSRQSTKGLVGERIKELERELVATQEHLQTTVEELETANEELQSLNEELQSANEELQSSNEELETSNEELQSTNEELTTLNEEIQERSAELSSANTDLENIQEAIGFGLVVVDKSCRLTRFTPAATALFEMSEEHLGHALTTIPTRLDMPFLREDVLEVVDTERARSREFQHGDMTYLFQVLPYRAPNQQTVGAVLMFIDKTADLLAEQALRESEGRFRQITEHIHDVFWVADSTGKTIQYVSPAYEKIWGRSCQSLYDRGLDWIDAIHPEDRAGTQHAFFDKAANGTFSQDFRIIQPDGTVRWIWDQAFPVSDAEGRVVRLVGIAKDITDRKQAEAAIREHEQQFRAVFNSAFQLMAILDTDGTVREVNQTMLDFCGVNAKDVVGKLLWEGPLKVMSSVATNQLQHAIASVMHGGSFARFTGEFVGSEEKTMTIDLSFRGFKGKFGKANSLIMEGREIR
ncbi:chemotaxis protein CheB [Nitrospira sp. M1]